MDTRDELVEHLRFFEELGVEGVTADDAWRVRRSEPRSEERSPDSRAADPRTSGSAVEPPAQPLIAVSRSAEEALRALRAELGDCTRCKLHTLGRRQIVWGVGNPEADLMFVGEGPGADEDIKGIPFVGRAGELLTKIIESIGLSREQVYIANVVKCRPPQNRNPEPDEIASCEPFLLGQIEAIEPKVIVALGTFAARTLLKTDEAISRMRGRTYEYRGATLIPTFHPAFLLRNPSAKREVWEDMKKVRSLLKDVGS
jgi:DNA polymerase